ncbi:hypothetical protein OAA60_02245 [Porticoccaceae bacterium]|jgi:hypothetical protein|nr:hypothetical protein [Porticoccaceae bacterium]
MKAVYIGAGIDIRPIKFLEHIKIFYYIDGLPFSNFGILQSNIIMKNGMDGYSNPRFISELDKNMTGINMKLINILDNIRIYSDGDQTVYYYTNTSIPEHYKKIKDAIINFDTLIVAGHDPNIIFMDATKKKLHFIGFEGTSYYNENENEGGPDTPNGIINKLHIQEIINKFEKYTYINNDGTHCSFDDWNSYYDHYNSHFFNKINGK